MLEHKVTILSGKITIIEQKNHQTGTDTCTGVHDEEGVPIYHPPPPHTHTLTNDLKNVF